MDRRTQLALVLALVLGGSAVTVGAVGPAAPPPEAADDWPTDRGDAGQTGSNAGAAPTGPNVTVAWSQDGTEPTGPVVVNGTVYVGYDNTTGSSPEASRGRVVAYDAATGETKWQQTALPAISHPPTVAGGLVYVMGQDAPAGMTVGETDPPDEQGGVYALDAATGEVVWKRNDTDPGSTPWRNPGEHVVADGRVYVEIGHSNNLYALDAETGETIWNRTVEPENGPGAAIRDLAFSDDTLVLRQATGSNGTAVHALSPATGEVRWTTLLPGTPTGRDPFPTVLFDSGIDTPGVAAVNGTAYLSVEHNHLYAVALDDGSVRWNELLSGTYPNSTTDWISTPAVHEGRVYVSTIDAGESRRDEYGNPEPISTVHALDAATGETDWRFDTAADLAAPTVANGTVYLGAYHSLVEEPAATTGLGSGVYALDADSGAKRWRYVIAGSAGWPIDDVLTLPVPAEGSLYVTEYVGEFSVQRGTIHALNSTTESVDPRNQFADDSIDTVLNDPPTVSIAADPPNATEEPVPPGTNVTLTADAADADGNLTEITWEVDGTVEQSGESLTLDIAACTTYDMTVRVTDDGGAITRERISIEGACEPGC